MTRDDIIRMAREAGWTGPEENVTYVAMLERFAILVYERAFIDGMQKQMQSSVDKAVNKMAQREWQGLVHDDIFEAEEKCEYYFDHKGNAHLKYPEQFARIIEAKLKLKNGYAEEKNSG
jgi:hypothetical protein